jgi:hypothetical protein
VSTEGGARQIAGIGLATLHGEHRYGESTGTRVPVGRGSRACCREEKVMSSGPHSEHGEFALGISALVTGSRTAPGVWR